MTPFQLVAYTNGWAQIKASVDMLLGSKRMADVTPQERRKAMGLADMPVTVPQSAVDLNLITISEYFLHLRVQ